MKFPPLSQSSKFILLQNNRVNKNKSQRCTKANFKHDIAIGTLRKIPAFSKTDKKRKINKEIIIHWMDNNQFSWSSCTLELIFFWGWGVKGRGLSASSRLGAYELFLPKGGPFVRGGG